MSKKSFEVADGGVWHITLSAVIEIAQVHPGKLTYATCPSCVLRKI